jgi:hypothetical protein
MTSIVDIRDSSRPRLNLIVGAIALTILLTGVFALGTFLIIRHICYYDARPWLCLGGTVSVLFITFVVRLFRWCGWKHLLLCLIPSLGIPLFVLSQLFHVGFDELEMYMTLGVLVGIIVGPGLLGMGIASWVGLYTNTAKRRWVAVLGAVVVVASVPAVQWLGWNVYAWYTSAHAETAGKAHLRAKAQELNYTHVVPTLETPISKGKNLIWCATFQVAWNELCTLAGEDIRMDAEDASVALLNRKEVKREHLDAGTYYVKAGSADNGGFDKISQDLNDKFKGAASPELLPAKSALPAGAFMAYAYLFANLPFEWAFDRHDFPLDFGGTKVESFGIAQYMKSHEKERLATTQLLIYSNNEKDVIIELKTRRTDHRLYLAMVPPLATLGETAKDVLSRVKRIEPSSLREMMSLIVPVIDFDLTRDYEELTDRPLRVRKFDGQPIVIAKQQIRFKLDERGAVLKSEAIIMTLGASPDLVFNKPFLVLLQYQDNEMPYFAAWIDNPELLIRK